eukprot:Polyplicarium_translucidae@DN2359_c0_g1_i1.p2
MTVSLEVDGVVRRPSLPTALRSTGAATVPTVCAILASRLRHAEAAVCDLGGAEQQDSCGVSCGVRGTALARFVTPAAVFGRVPGRNMGRTSSALHAAHGPWELQQKSGCHARGDGTGFMFEEIRVRMGNTPASGRYLAAQNTLLKMATTGHFRQHTPGLYEGDLSQLGVAAHDTVLKMAMTRLFGQQTPGPCEWNLSQLGVAAQDTELSEDIEAGTCGGGEAHEVFPLEGPDRCYRVASSDAFPPQPEVVLSVAASKSTQTSPQATLTLPQPVAGTFPSRSVAASKSTQTSPQATLTLPQPVAGTFPSRSVAASKS